MQKRVKPHIQVSMKTQVFLNPQKLVPRKINESTVVYIATALLMETIVLFIKNKSG